MSLRRAVSRKGARTLTAQVVSKPSSESDFWVSKTPALLMSTSRESWSALTASANCRICDSEARLHVYAEVFPPRAAKSCCTFLTLSADLPRAANRSQDKISHIHNCRIQSTSPSMQYYICAGSSQFSRGMPSNTVSASSDEISSPWKLPANQRTCDQMHAFGKICWRVLRWHTPETEPCTARNTDAVYLICSLFLSQTQI